MATGLIAWFTFGGGVRAEDVKAMIKESPSIVSIQEQMQQVKGDIEELKKQVKESDERTQGKLDRLLDDNRNDNR